MPLKELERQRNKENRDRGSLSMHDAEQDLTGAFAEALAAERRATRRALEALRAELAGEVRALRAEVAELRRGRSFEICGTYDPNEHYFRLDVVALGGASFIARRDDPGRCPGEGWQLLAQQGRRGKPGPAGPRGEKGEAR